MLVLYEAIETKMHNNLLLSTIDVTAKGKSPPPRLGQTTAENVKDGTQEFRFYVSRSRVTFKYTKIAKRRLRTLRSVFWVFF